MSENTGFTGVVGPNEPAGDVPPCGDVASVEVLPPDAPPVKRRGQSTGHMRRNMAVKVRSFERSQEIKRMIIEEGKTVSQTARDMGMSRKRVSQLWNAMVRRSEAGLNGTAEEVEEERKQVRAFTGGVIRAVIQKSMALIDESPAYAAAVLKGVEMLNKHHGIEIGADAGGKADVAGNEDEELRKAKEVATSQLKGLAGVVLSPEALHARLEASKPVRQAMATMTEAMGGEG